MIAGKIDLDLNEVSNFIGEMIDRRYPTFRIELYEKNTGEHDFALIGSKHAFQELRKAIDEMIGKEEEE